MRKEPGLGRSNALANSWDSGIEAFGPRESHHAGGAWIVPSLTKVPRGCREKIFKNFMKKEYPASMKFNRLASKGQSDEVGRLTLNQ